MRIFVTGATGYIGFQVAQALRRAGHEVLGLARTPEKAKSLSRQEIEPVIGTMEKPDSYLAPAASCSVLIHAAMEWTAKGADLDRTTVETLLLGGNRGPQPKRFIYTSGVWLYGNTVGLADETTDLNPPRLVTWRKTNEQRVLNASSMRTVVARPGCVYGKQGGLTASWFSGATKDKAQVIGDGKNRWTLVHVDDLADAYVRLVESECTGIFNFTDRSRNTISEMAHAAAAAAGAPGKVEFVSMEDAVEKLGDYAACLALDQHVDSRKAVRLLGWQPKFGGFVDGVQSFYASWKAYQG